MCHNKDEGFDDCPRNAELPSPPQSLPSSSSGSKSATSRPATLLFGQPTMAAAERRMIESLAHSLKASVNPQSCTNLAIMLLAQVPADMLKQALEQLDLLLRRDFIGALPMEIATQILEHLPMQDICLNVSLVNRRWYALANQPCIWRKLFNARGWKLDRKRWDFYYALPRGISPTKMLLDSAVFQVSRALTLSTPPVALADTRESRNAGEMMIKEQYSSLDSDAIQAMLLSDSISSLAMSNISAVTLRSMMLDSNRQPARKPRKMLYSLLDLQRQTALARCMDPQSAVAMSAQQSYRRQMHQRLQKSPRYCMAPGSRHGMGNQAGSLLSSSPEDPRSQSTSGSSSPTSPLTLSAMRLSPHQNKDTSWSTKPVDWRVLYSEYHRLLGNWRDGRCRVDRWESAHSESVYTLQFDRRNRLFTGSRDNSVKVWHLSETGSQLTPLATLRGHSGSVLTLQAEDNVLVTGSSDRDACVWDTESLSIRQRLSHPDAVLSLRFNARWLATACKDGVVRVWQRHEHEFIEAGELLGHTVAINAVHLHNDMLVSASGDRTVKVWDLTTQTCVLTLAEHTRGVACLDFDGEFIASGSSDRSIRIWNVSTGLCERTIANAHSDLVRTLMFDRKMDIIISGSYDESIKIWRFSTGALIHKIKNVHTSRVFRLVFDRSRIVSCSHDGSISIIDFAAELPHARLLL